MGWWERLDSPPASHTHLNPSFTALQVSVGTGPCPSGTQGWGDYREFITSVGRAEDTHGGKWCYPEPRSPGTARPLPEEKQRLTSDLTQVPFIAIIN